MRIAAVQHVLPSQAITNAWVIRQLRDHNRSRLPPGELDAVEQAVDSFLTAAGTEVRYQLADGERALDLVAQASRRALEAGGRSADEVDLVLYTGIGRGWIEPATAVAVQAELGMTRATAFDVLEACASWLRALQVVYALFRTGLYRCGLIVNAECGLYRSYADWRIDSIKDLDYRLAMCTIGEAATATLVTDEDPASEYHFSFQTFPEHLKLCMVPTRGIADFLPGGDDSRFEPGRFLALSRELLPAGIRRVLEVFESDPRLRERPYDLTFGHNASERASEILARRLGLEDSYFSTHREFGNTASASIPLAMSVALERGRLQRGHEVLAVVGSAGITVAIATFTF